MKRIMTLLALFCSFSAFALTASSLKVCPQSTPIEHPQFCATFKEAATCRCTEMGLPRSVCENMNTVYQLMKDRFGSIEAACKWQADTSHDTTVADCVAKWNAYFQKCPR
jgi:hypothetical protein